MRKVAGIICILASAALLVFAVIHYYPKFMDYKKGRDVYNSLRNEYTKQPDDTDEWEEYETDTESRPEEAVTEKRMEKAPETVSRSEETGNPETVSEKTAGRTHDAATELTLPETASEDISEALPSEGASETVPGSALNVGFEAPSDSLTEFVSEIANEAITESVSETANEALTETATEALSEGLTKKTKTKKASEMKGDLERILKRVDKKLRVKDFLPIEVDYEKLLDENTDYIGWIYIPGTNISYPVVKSKDNTDYLHKNFKKESNFPGTIFMDCACNKTGITGHHIILYGHNMRDGSMFASIKSYVDEKFFKEHPVIWFITPKYTLLYSVFSAYEADPYDNKVTFSTQGDEFKTNKEWDKIVKKMKEKSAVKCDIEPNGLDFVLSLSTCTNQRTTRIVPHAVLEGSYEPAKTAKKKGPKR